MAPARTATGWIGVGNNYSLHMGISACTKLEMYLGSATEIHWHSTAFNLYSVKAFRSQKEFLYNSIKWKSHAYSDTHESKLKEAGRQFHPFSIKKNSLKLKTCWTHSHTEMKWNRPHRSSKRTFIISVAIQSGKIYLACTEAWLVTRSCLCILCW